MSASPQLHISEEFARFLEVPNRENFRELLRGHLGEFDFLDFKENWPEQSKLAKHILAFANSGTGCIVIGVSEREDGTYDTKGLTALEDKTKLKDSVQKFLPEMVAYNIFDFEYDAAEYQHISGKKFQLLWVEHNDESIPILSLADGTSVMRNRIYVRQNDSTREANHDQVQALINKRITRSMQTPKSRKLNEHLSDLETLHRQKPVHFSLLERFDPMHPMQSFDKFLDRMIALKQSKIEELLES